MAGKENSGLFEAQLWNVCTRFPIVPKSEEVGFHSLLICRCTSKKIVTLSAVIVMPWHRDHTANTTFSGRPTVLVVQYSFLITVLQKARVVLPSLLTKLG
jgi:hypothetical protein